MIKYVYILLMLSNFALGQSDFFSQSIHTYEDCKNINDWWPREVKKVWIDMHLLSSEEWQISTEYYEFNDSGNISMHVHTINHNNEWLEDTVKYTYHNCGLWQTKRGLYGTSNRNFKIDSQGRVCEIIRKGRSTWQYVYEGDNDKPSVVKFNSKYWNEYVYDSSYRIMKFSKFKDSALSETYNYFYDEKMIRCTQTSFLSDTLNDVTEVYYNDDGVIKKVFKTYDFDQNGAIPVVAITAFRYEKNRLVNMSDCLSNDANSGYKDYFYDERENVINVVEYSENGTLKTKEIAYKYDYR